MNPTRNESNSPQPYDTNNKRQLLFGFRNNNSLSPSNPNNNTITISDIEKTTDLTFNLTTNDIRNTQISILQRVVIYQEMAMERMRTEIEEQIEYQYIMIDLNRDILSELLVATNINMKDYIFDNTCCKCSIQ